MLASVELITGLLLREQYRFAPAAVRAALESGGLGGVPPAELPLISAAASISGGEPRRALRELEALSAPPGSDEQAAAQAIRRLAQALDRNWFPGGGGAVLDEGDLERMLDGAADQATAASPAVALLIQLATNVLAMAPTWRTVADSGRRLGLGAAAGAVLGHAQQVGAAIAQHGAPAAVGYVALVQADLFVRAGQGAAAPAALGVVEMAYGSTSDWAGLGSAWLVRGDWSAEPTSQPETLGLDLESAQVPPGPSASRDARAARQAYDQAASAFAAAGAQRGLAAVELRRAHLDRLAGDGAGARQRLEAVVRTAVETGDGALAQLARIHLALLDIEGGRSPAAGELGTDVAGWVKRDGSYSYARGLARLCLAFARRRREEGDFLLGRAALSISDAINSGIGAVAEPALVGAETAELYGGANYRRALLVLTQLEIDAAIDRQAAQPEGLAWIQLVDRATRAHSAASALRDSDALAASAARLARLRDIGAGLAAAGTAGEPQFVALASGTLGEFIAQAGVQVPLYRATRARAAGLPEEAARRFDEAVAAARQVEPEDGLLTAVVLATMGRPDEARPAVERMIAAGQLPRDLATLLLMRLGDAAGAQAALARQDAAAVHSGQGEPLADVALRAEILAANGDWPSAARHADEGIAKFEGRLARLSRDVLRISAADDSEVVSLYTTALRARLALADDVAAAFRLSDRCRGTALADLLADDQLAGEPEAAAVLRRWLRAGVELAQVFEVASQAQHSHPARVRAEIARAERRLDEAEEELERRAPALLAARRQPRPTPELADVQALLGPETLLLQYHSFDDEVFAWAVSASAARLVRRRAPTAQLTGDARRFHVLCADVRSSADERTALASRLAELLLEPLASELAAHPRVIVVPHAGLSLLPYHLLPLDGDVLGTGHTVSYLPAASIAPRWRGRPMPRLGPDALVVGDPRYAPALGLSRLPAARTEAAAIARRLGSEALLAEAATGEAFAARIASAHVLHLATHGRAIDGAPNSAELALASGDRLTIAELMGMDAQVDLAVLSACDTGRGTTTASGDVVGLARALLAAGARDIVVSLWPVDDRAACLTMVHFYECLQAGSDVSLALAAAQAELRRRSEAEQAAWYEEIAAGLELPTEAPLAGTRAWSAPENTAEPAGGRAQSGAHGTDRAGHPALWGPFIHIGLQ
ncbi:MAG TPA: CHAT domain-containing protein [Candidatus Limnocylindria bacterium]|nr:CHAT domain-containing protein [Candidatus Limnocylindria bacterium]